jgi:hypothetical protein
MIPGSAPNKITELSPPWVTAIWATGDCVFESGGGPFKAQKTVANEQCVEDPHMRTAKWYRKLLEHGGGPGVRATQGPHGGPATLGVAAEIGIDKGNT